MLGYDAAGVVEEVGRGVTRFKPGDAVFYAGDMTRPGTNAELHLVDERIVGHKPASLNFPQAAALPLTAITAWEAMFDRLDVKTPVPGVAPRHPDRRRRRRRRLDRHPARAQADRPYRHRDGLAARDGRLGQEASARITSSTIRSRSRRRSRRSGLGAPGFVFSTTGTGGHMAAIAELIAPQGRFALIDDPDVVDINPFKRKSVSVHWEFMFTRSMFKTADMDAQGALLDEVSKLVDQGVLKTTLNEVLGPINAANLKRAHAIIESGKARGKVVLEGF